MRITTQAIILAAAAALAACGQKGLRELDAPGTGPDEFLIMPAKPLSEPPSYAALPAPTPGGGNITDQNPQADAVAALGGSPAALAAGGAVPSADAALVTASSRYGVEPGVRSQLASEDQTFRERESWTARIKLFNVDRYEDAYKRQAIDPFAVTESFRKAGIATPSAPPSQ